MTTIDERDGPVCGWGAIAGNAYTRRMCVCVRLVGGDTASQMFSFYADVVLYIFVQNIFHQFSCAFFVRMLCMHGIYDGNFYEIRLRFFFVRLRVLNICYAYKEDTKPTVRFE